MPRHVAGAPHRKIVSRHLLRRTAYETEHRLNRLQVRAAQTLDPDPVAVAEYARLGISTLARLHVERAGRIRARWIVVASW